MLFVWGSQCNGDPVILPPKDYSNYEGPYVRPLLPKPKPSKQPEVYTVSGFEGSGQRV